MFWKKSNLTNQIKLKQEILNDINLSLYHLEKGKHNKALDAEAVNSLLKDLRSSYKRLENSFGNGETDISLGCEKVRKSLKELEQAANGNLFGRFEDAAVNLMADIDEIIDLENEVISVISEDVDNSSKRQKTLFKKLGEISEIEQIFITNKNRVEAEIAKLERDKKELDSKLLAESSPRIKQSIFRQIQAEIKKMEMLQVKSSQYASCYNLLSSIKAYANELIKAGQFSETELDKARIILDINRLRYVLDDPAKLEPLLKRIAADLQKSQKSVADIETGIDKAFALNKESYDAMMEYEKNLIDERSQKQEISGTVSDLEEYIKGLNK